MTLIMRATSKWGQPQYEDDLKNNDGFKNEDDPLEYKENLNYEDKLKPGLILLNQLI